MAEELRSEVVPTSIPKSCDEYNDGNHHPNPSAVTDVTAENENDVSGNNAGMLISDGDDSKMRDIRHPPSALYQHPMCEHDTPNPDLMYSQNALSANPMYPSIAINGSSNLEYQRNVRNPNQIYEPDVCSEPAHRPANSDGTPSIEPLAATHQEVHDDDDDNNKPTTSDAAAEIKEIDVVNDVAVEVNAVPFVRPKSTSRPVNIDLYIRPYAVRYPTHDDNRGGTPYAGRHQEDDEDEIPPEIDGADGNRRTYHTAPDDIDITPYAVAYMCQYDMTDVTRRDASMNDADTSASVRDDSNVQRIQHDWRTLHHQHPSSIPNFLNPNAMYVPNVPQQAARDRNYKQHTRRHTLTNLLQLRRFYSKHRPGTDADLRCYDGVFDCDVYHNGFCHDDFYINVKNVLPPDDGVI
ncbi:Hypp3745 [Branchiostoma lanceolatum]|uniref:Hypp3745 protein n=1 Tax=Branchiostoma lanceolatum TaxID=7740 RepID=A0A8K0ESU6_BRALA|nr:Hypp3745 [Branchiostoma lanceolatum]